MVTEGLGNYTSLNEDWKSAFAMKKQGREQSEELKSFKELVDLIRSGDFTGENAKRPVFSMQYSRDMSGNLLFRPAGQKKEEDMDWRDMPDEEWNRLLEGYDKYLETVREEQEQWVEKQQDKEEEKELRELSRYQEVMLANDTAAGIGKTEDGLECAAVSTGENGKKIWTITAFTEQGIISNQCQDGKIISHWELMYRNSGEAERVKAFREQMDEEDDLEILGSKKYWEEFLEKSRGI